MEEIATKFQQAKEDVQQFKKDHDAIFKRMNELKNKVSECRKQMTLAMDENNLKIFEHMDTRFEKRMFGSNIVHVSKKNAKRRRISNDRSQSQVQN